MAATSASDKLWHSQHCCISGGVCGNTSLRTFSRVAHTSSEYVARMTSTGSWSTMRRKSFMFTKANSVYVCARIMFRHTPSVSASCSPNTCGARIVSACSYAMSRQTESTVACGEANDTSVFNVWRRWLGCDASGGKLTLADGIAFFALRSLGCAGGSTATVPHRRIMMPCVYAGSSWNARASPGNAKRIAEHSTSISRQWSGHRLKRGDRFSTSIVLTSSKLTRRLWISLARCRRRRNALRLRMGNM